MKTVILALLLVGCAALCLWREYAAKRRLKIMARKVQERRS